MYASDYESLCLGALCLIGKFFCRIGVWKENAFRLLSIGYSIATTFLFLLPKNINHSVKVGMLMSAQPVWIGSIA
jgi:hypothetical protein